MKTILFSTTRQYNPGDEFILMGLENLFKEIPLSYNSVIANRNPMIDKLSKRTYKDNSFNFSNWDLIDYVVFAGSPAWWQNRSSFFDVVRSVSDKTFINTFGRFININRSYVTDKIHKGIRKHNKRCSFLGIGSGRSLYHINKEVQSTLDNNTDLIVVRDEKTLKSIPEKYKPILLPCPALFSSSFEKQVTQLSKILFILQSKNVKMKYDGIPESTLKNTINKYLCVKKAFGNVKIACFVWQDYVRLSKMISKKDLIHNFRSESWASILAEFDLVISTRVHGCGLASSLNIPNIMINKGFRTDTALLFNSIIVDSDTNLINIIRSLDLKDISKKMAAHKAVSKKNWIDILRDGISLTN